MATIYRKTDKGHEEISTRRHQLPMKLRSALILVDGKRSDKDLGQMILGGGAEEVLATLLAQGFIETIAVTADRAVAKPAGAADQAPASAPQAAPAPPPVRTLPELQRASVRFLTDHLGPTAELMCTRIEEARTADAVQALLVKARDVLRDARGSSVADQFAREFLGRG